MEVIGIIILALLVYWHWKSNNVQKSPLSKFYFIGLTSKLLLGVGVGLLYTFFYQGGDTFALFHDAQFLTDLGKNQPKEYINFIFCRPYHYPEHIQSQLMKSNASTSIFCIVLSLINFLTNSNYWISGAYLSVFSFIGIWKYIDILKQKYPQLNYSLIIPYFILPSFAFWSSGIIKESISMGLIFLSIGYLLQIIYYRKSYYKGVSIIFISLLLLLQIKFYYFLFIILLIGLNSFMLYNDKKERSIDIKQTTIFLLGIGSIVMILPYLHYHFDYHRVLNTIQLNYVKLYDASKEGTAIYLPYLDGSWLGLLKSLPFAIIGAFELTNLFSDKNTFQTISIFENLGTIVLLIYTSTLFFKSPKIKKRPFLKWTLLLSIVLTLLFIGLLGIASPNLGSLNRYKILFISTLIHISFMIIDNNKKSYI